MYCLLALLLPVLAHAALAPVHRQSSCARSDSGCLSMAALAATNQVRARAGKGPLSSGAQAQLENAIRYSRELSRLGRLTHQNLRSTNIGCGAFFSGENLAQNFARSGETGLAEKCVKQLENSSPHYRNMISDTHQYVVMGIIVDSDGRLWCTQTFATGTQFGSGNCARVSAGTAISGETPSANLQTPQETPQRVPNEQTPTNQSIPPQGSQQGDFIDDSRMNFTPRRATPSEMSMHNHPRSRKPFRHGTHQNRNMRGHHGSLGMHHQGHSSPHEWFSWGLKVHNHPRMHFHNLRRFL